MLGFLVAFVGARLKRDRTGRPGEVTMDHGAVGRDDVVAELAAVGADFRSLVEGASRQDLSRGTDGTRWTNRQLLFHMLFGYLLVVVLRPLVRTFAHLPRPVSRTFARALNALTRPFHVVNYLGSLGGGRVLGRRGMVWLFDRVTGRLQPRSAAPTTPRWPAGCTSRSAGTPTSVTS